MGVPDRRALDQQGTGDRHTPWIIQTLGSK